MADEVLARKIRRSRWGAAAWALGVLGLLLLGADLEKISNYGLTALGWSLSLLSLAALALGWRLLARHWPVRVAGIASLVGAWIAWGWQSGDMPAASKSPIVVAIALIFAVLGLFQIGVGSMRKAGSYVVLLAIATFLITPFIWMLVISLHPPKTPIPPLAEMLPRDPQGGLSFAWSNYSFVLFHPNLPVARFFINTIFVTISVVLGQLFVASLAAYGFARLRFRGREWVFALFLGSMMFAGPVTQIPVYLLLRDLHWLDTYWALIIPGVSSAFSIFLLRQFFLQIPKELDEAARMDGAGDFLIYWRVVLPLSRAALATCAAFTFIGVWTDFFGPLIYTNTTEMRTLEVGLSIFKNSYGGTNWPLQMTAAVIVMLPLLIVFLFTQRYFVKGITLGSIK